MESFETTSTALSFILYNLAANPAHQERVHKEIRAVLLRHNHKFTYDTLQEMTYLDCVIYGEILGSIQLVSTGSDRHNIAYTICISESMRLTPVIMRIRKSCTKEYTLPRFGTQKEGVIIYPGTSVIIPVLAIHM